MVSALKTLGLNAFRDFEIPGVPASGRHAPELSAIRSWVGPVTETAERALMAAAVGVKGYATVEDLPETAQPGTIAAVDDVGKFRFEDGEWLPFADPALDGVPTATGGNIQAQAFRQALGIFIFRPEDYVAPGEACGDGIVDDVVALNAASYAASQIKGAEVWLRPDGHYRVIGADWINHVGVTVRGQLSLPGVPGSSYTDLNRIWTHLGSRIDVAPNRTIRLRGACGLINCWTNRDGLNGQITAHSAAVRDAAFAGVHVTVEGDDTFLMNFMSLGAEYPWVCVGHNRPLLADIRWDASYGFKTQQTLDIPRGRNVHQFPYLTFGMPGNASESAEHQDHRPGVAYDFAGRNDWIQQDGFFAYSHLRVYRIRVSSEGPGVGEKPITIQLNNCGADGLAFPAAPWVVPDSVGFELVGNVSEVRLIAPTAAARDLGYLINLSSPTAKCTLVAPDAHGCRRGLLAAGGVVEIVGGTFRGLNGIYGNVVVEGVGIETQGHGRVVIGPDSSVEGFAVSLKGNDLPGSFIGRPRVDSAAILGLAQAQVPITGTTAQPSGEYRSHMIVGPANAVLGTLGTLGEPGRTDAFYFLNATKFPADSNVDVGQDGEDLTISAAHVLMLMDVGDGWSIVRSTVTIPPEDPGEPDPAPPMNLAPPVISGTPRVGSTLTAGGSAWNPPGTSYSGQWRKNATAIPGATTTSYTCISGDLSAMIDYVETATNADGTSSVASAAVGPVAAATGAITDYDTFVAAMTAKATDGSANWNDPVPNLNGKWITTVSGAPSGNMRGSSWGARAFEYESVVSRILQHGLPNSAAMTAQVAGGFVIFFEVVRAFDYDAGEPGYDRNDYDSLARGASEGIRLSKVIYWDGTTAKEMSPMSSSGPTSYIHS